MVKYGCLSASHHVQVPRTSLRPNLGELYQVKGEACNGYGGVAREMRKNQDIIVHTGGKSFKKDDNLFLFRATVSFSCCLICFLFSKNLLLKDSLYRNM